MRKKKAIIRLVKFHDYQCVCVLCRRGRKFYRITDHLKLCDRQWMRRFYNSVMDIEVELEMRQANENTE